MTSNGMFHRLMGTTRNVININQTQTGGDNIVQAQSINITQTISGDGNTVVGISVNDGSENELEAKTDLFEKTSEGGIAMTDWNFRIAESLINQAHENGYTTKKVYDSGLTKDDEEEVNRMIRELHEGRRKAEQDRRWKVHNKYGISNNTNVLGETIGEFYWVYDKDGEVCLEQNSGNTVKHYYHWMLQRAIKRRISLAKSNGIVLVVRIIFSMTLRMGRSISFFRKEVTPISPSSSMSRLLS